MKNRFTSLVLVSIMAFCIVCSPVSAATDTSISVDEYTLSGMEVVIKGITGPVASDYLTVVVVGEKVTDPLSPGTPEYRYVGTLKSIALGKFGDINIDLNYEQSDEPKQYAITVHLDSKEASAPKTIELTYCNVVKLNEMIDDAVEYKFDPADQIGQNVVAYMAGSADKQIFEDSGVWISEYSAMEQELKDAVNNAVGKVYSDLTAAKLNEIVNGSIIACTMSKAEEDKVLNKLKKYEEGLFDPEDGSTWVFGIKGKEKEDGSIPTLALKNLDEASQRWVVGNVKENAGNSQTAIISTYEDMQKEVKQSMLLSMVNTEHYSYLEKLLTENTDILDGDWSAFTSLTSQQDRNAVMQDVKVDNNNNPVEYKSLDALLKAVNDAVDALPNVGDNNGGNGGGGIGSSGGSGGGSGSFGGNSGSADVTLTLGYGGTQTTGTQ